MLFSDGTSGCFSDVPFIGPVEGSAFYNTVLSSRLHRLTETLMFSTTSLDYYMDSTCFLAQKLSSGEGFSNLTFRARSKFRKSGITTIPFFQTDFSSYSPIFPSVDGNFVTIRAVSSRSATAAHMSEFSNVELSIAGISDIWANMLSYIVGCRCSKPWYVISNIDLQLSSDSGVGDFFLSVLMLGVSSILHWASFQPKYWEMARDVALEFTIMATTAGMAVGDLLQCFIESHLKICVTRVIVKEEEGNDRIDICAVAEVVTCASSEAEWIDTVKDSIVDLHEGLCDDDGAVPTPKSLTSPAVLLVLPEGHALRDVLAKLLLDSYTSEPIRIMSDGEWSLQSFLLRTPVIFLCSSGWITSQARESKADRLLDRLNLKAVVHGGFCEYGDSLEEELVHTLSVLSFYFSNHDYTFRIHKLSALHFTSYAEPKLLLGSSTALNVLLLICRRFSLSTFSTSGRQMFSFDRNCFVSEKGWLLFNGVACALCHAGVLQKKTKGVDDYRLVLTVLGRLLSYQFRICENQEVTDFLVADVKTILWCHLLRQPRHVAVELISESHRFSDWVCGSLDTLCQKYGVALTDEGVVIDKGFVRQLAWVGLGSSEDNINRAHYIISSPFGVRKSIGHHYTRHLPTQCRGWYEQAPLKAELLVEKQQVKTFCLPSLSHYCELEGASDDPAMRIQCPVELSYPLIVAQSLLYVALHNNCIFLESPHSSGMVRLPMSILQSPTLRTLMGIGEWDSVGLWLDGNMTDDSLASSDASVFAPLSCRGDSHIGCCERNFFHRKRRREDTSTIMVQPSDAFNGMQPRTLGELDAIEEFVKLVSKLGKERAEKSFKGKKGFGFIDSGHDLHPYYLHKLVGGVTIDK